MRASTCDYVRLLRNLCEEHKNAGIIFVECENCEACGILVKNGPQKRMRHYRDTNRTTHVGQPRTKRDSFRHYPDTHRTSPRVSRIPWRPSAPTPRQISHSEPSQNSFCGHLGLTHLLPIILGVSLLQPFCRLLTIVSQGKPSLSFLLHQAVARWVAWGQSSLSQAFLALPAVASWILAAYLIGSLFCSFDQLSPSEDTLESSFPNTIEPLLALPLFRPPLPSPRLHAASINDTIPTRNG